jgi:hypothetical protein
MEQLNYEFDKQIDIDKVKSSPDHKNDPLSLVVY